MRLDAVEGSWESNFQNQRKGREHNMITTGVGFLAFITFYTALFLWAAKKYPLKLYKVFPPILIIYVVTMILFTCGAWTMTESVTATKTALVNNMVPAMVFLMCLNCNVKRILKLGPKLILTFFCATITICAGFGFLCNFWPCAWQPGCRIWRRVCFLDRWYTELSGS